MSHYKNSNIAFTVKLCIKLLFTELYNYIHFFTPYSFKEINMSDNICEINYEQLIGF